MPTTDVSARRLKTPVVSGELYKRYGLVVSRDRLYEITDLVLGTDEVQPGPNRRRLYSEDQLEILATGMMLKQFGYQDDDIRALTRNPNNLVRAQKAMRECTATMQGLQELVSAVG